MAYARHACLWTFWDRLLSKNMAATITFINPQPFREWPPLHLHPPAHAAIDNTDHDQAGFRLASWLCCFAMQPRTYSHLLWRMKRLHTCAVHNKSDVLLRKMKPAAISHKHLFKRCGSFHFDRNRVSFLWQAKQQPRVF